MGASACDILLVQPPRPTWALEFVRQTAASRPIPAPELISTANRLREDGFRAEVLNADVYDEARCHEAISNAVASNVRAIAFLLRAYRIPAALRLASWVSKVAHTRRPATIAFGFLPKGFGATDAASAFNEILLGPAWETALAGYLDRLGVRPGPALDPKVELGEFFELTGCSGLSACIEAPSRICPHRCIFCEHRLFDRYEDAPAHRRIRSVTEVLDELLLARKHGARSFVCLEGNFLTYHEWTAAFADGLRERFQAVPFAVGTRLSDIIRSEASGELAKLVRAGLVSVCSGIESGNNEILARARKDATTADYVEADRILRRFGIRRFYNIILGLPGESRDTIGQTWEFARRLDPDGLQVSIATPLPGTPLHELAEESGWLTTTDLEYYYYYGSAVLALQGLATDYLLKCQSAIHAEFTGHQALLLSSRHHLHARLGLGDLQSVPRCAGEKADAARGCQFGQRS